MNLYFNIVHSIFYHPLNDKGKYSNHFIASSMVLYVWKPSLLSYVSNELLIFPECSGMFVASNNILHGISAPCLYRIEVCNLLAKPVNSSAPVCKYYDI